MTPTRDEIAGEFKRIQNEICSGLEKLDGKSHFVTDTWQRNGGGGGITRVISKGHVIEKGGVNFSEVFGDLPAALKEEFKNAAQFFAAGVSIVLHSQNP